VVETRTETEYTLERGTGRGGAVATLANTPRTARGCAADGRQQLGDKPASHPRPITAAWMAAEAYPLILEAPRSAFHLIRHQVCPHEFDHARVVVAVREVVIQRGEAMLLAGFLHAG
jgi:hypothetical protein